MRDGIRHGSECLDLVAVATRRTGSEAVGKRSECARAGVATRAPHEHLPAHDEREPRPLALGGSTTFSASEVAAAMVELGAAGMSTEQIMAAVPGVLAAAASEGMGLADAATVMSDTLTQFGLSADQSARVADVLAQGAAQSSADIGQMGHSLRYAAPAAAALGMTMEDTTAAVMGLAAAGIRGEQAGTTLRGGLLSLVNPGKQASDAMERIGFSITDAQGKVKPFSQIIGELARKTDTMTEAERTRTVAQIVGTEASSGFLALLRQGQPVLEGYRKGLDDATGAAERMAAVQTDNLKGDLDELSGAWEALQLAFSDSQSGTMREAVQALTGVLQTLQGTSEDTTKAMGEMRRAMSQADEVRNLAKEYAELANKKRLTTEQAQRLRDIEARLAELAPSLIQGFDNQGRAIVRYSDKVWEAVRANEALAKAAIAAAQAQAAAQINEGAEGLSVANRALQGDAGSQFQVRGGVAGMGRAMPALFASPVAFLAVGGLEASRYRNTDPRVAAGQQALQSGAQRQQGIEAFAATLAARENAHGLKMTDIVAALRAQNVQNAEAMAVPVHQAFVAALRAQSGATGNGSGSGNGGGAASGGSSRSASRTQPEGPSAEELARREEAAQRLRVQLMEDSTARRIALLDQEHKAHIEIIAKSGKSEAERTAMVAEADAWLAREKGKVRADERQATYEDAEQSARREDARMRLNGTTEEKILKRRVERIQTEIAAETDSAERREKLEQDLEDVRLAIDEARARREEKDAARRQQIAREDSEANLAALADANARMNADEAAAAARARQRVSVNPNNAGAVRAAYEADETASYNALYREHELRRDTIDETYRLAKAAIEANVKDEADRAQQIGDLDRRTQQQRDDAARDAALAFDGWDRDRAIAHAKMLAEIKRIEIERTQQMVERFTQVVDQAGQWLFERERMRMEEQARLEQQRFDERQSRIDAEEQAAYDKLDAETGRKQALSAEEQAYENRRAAIAADAEKKRQKLQAEQDAADLRRRREQAIFEKKQAVWKIVLGTMAGVALALSETNYVKAGIVAAEGAIAAAVAAAQPLPQFATGVTNFQPKGGAASGLAIVGERGPEVVTLGRGANVLTNERVNDVLRAHLAVSAAPERLALQDRLMARIAAAAPPPTYLVAQQSATTDPRLLDVLNAFRNEMKALGTGFDRLAERIQAVEFRQSGTEMRGTLVAERERLEQLRTPAPI